MSTSCFNDRVCVNFGQSPSCTFTGITFLRECGKRLSLSCLTISTACCLFHRFFKTAKIEQHDIFLVCCACLYLSGKIEESTQLKIRDLINVSNTILQGHPEPLSLDSHYYSLREALCQIELLLLRMVNFQTNFDHPHRYILSCLCSLRDWIDVDVWGKYPIAGTSWTLLNDFYQDKKILDMNRWQLALGCIGVALNIHGIQVPHSNGKEWYQCFSPECSRDSFVEAMNIIMDVYSKEEKLSKINT